MSDAPALELVLLENPGREVEDAILRPLIAYNEQAGGPTRWAPFAIVVRAPGSDDVLGGLYGACFYDWCFVRLLVVPAHARGQGLGTRLLDQAEDFARGQGATGIWLDTFSFQAPGFYEKRGFTRFGELSGHPANGSRVFYQKRFG